MTEKLLSTAAAAKMLQMTSRRISGLCQEGKLKGAVKVGRNWNIPESSVLAFRPGINMPPVTEEERNLLPIAVGNTSFVEVAGDCYYVDKTLLIKELIDDRNMVTLFTRPRRFGKTLALNMLKTFFEITDSDTAQFFRDKKIWQCGEKYRQFQGAYPVIMLTFKDVKYDDWGSCLEAIRLLLKDEYKRHSELGMNDALDQDDRDYLRRMEQGLLSDVEYSRALLNLVRLLATYHQSKVVILIDEYDTPIQQGYAKGFYQDVISFMRNFLSGGLKDNPDLAFGVLTGIMRVSKENLFSGLNNPTVNTVLDEKYSQFFGFTEEEVRAMASYYGKADRMEEVRLWYDGYLFGNTSVYNPWSVTNYFSNGGQAKAYWANTSDNEIIHELMRGLTPEIADNLQSVMQGEEIHAALDMEVIYPRIADGADTIFSFLLLAGYLTTVGLPKETEFGTFAELKLPNTEVRRVYNTEILGWLRQQPAGTVIPEIEKAIYRSDGDRLQQALRKYMISCISSFDGAAEGFYHGMILGLVASLSSRYFIRSNREAGDGRFDLQLEPKDLKLPGILMEFKAAREASDTSLSNLAEEALSQIEKKQYATELSERGVSQIVTYGIAFSGKQVVVKSGQI